MFDEGGEAPWSGNRPVNGKQPRSVGGSGEAASSLKAAYVVARSLFEARCAGSPRDYSPSPKWDGEEAFEDNPEISSRKSTWERMASKLATLEVDPVDLVRRLFDDLGPSERPIMPNQLASSSTLSRYDRLVAEAAPDIELALKSQLEVLITAFRCSDTAGTQVDVWVGVLLDEGLSLSALFRYCLALQHAAEALGEGPFADVTRFERVAEHYEIPANEQYRKNKDAYDRTWKKILPPGLRNESSSL